MLLNTFDQCSFVGRHKRWKVKERKPHHKVILLNENLPETFDQTLASQNTLKCILLIRVTNSP